MLALLRSGLREAASGVAAYAEAALNETTVRLAVTGLSRAGKTVFLVSLIHNLLALGQRRDTLPLLTRCLGPDGGARLRGIRVRPSGSAATPPFDYAAKLADLAADAPAWPSRTDEIARLTLDLAVARPGAVARRLGARRLRLELLDYPGEWLLDLPLLERSHAQWSRDTLPVLRRPARVAAFTPFLDALASLDPAAPADEARLRQLHELYRAALRDCRDRLGLRFLQPGRFNCPGPRSDAPFLWFFPAEGVPDEPARGSNAALLRDRFEAYKADLRAGFLEPHFAAFDRQVVLVDVLGTLHAGREAYEDTAKALAAIAGCLSYGSNGPLRLGRRRIERVAFVATKADHVPSMRRENLRNLLRALVEDAPGVHAPILRQQASFHAAAAVQATEDATALIEGRSVEVVRGLPLGGTVRRAFYPGDVPSGRPPERFWSSRYFELPVFAPPRLDPSGAAGIPHLGLDAVLAALLGDAL